MSNGEPTGPRPPALHTVKLEINYSNAQGRQAHNITYGRFGDTVDSSDIATVTAAAEKFWTAITVGGGSLAIFLASGWSLNSVTASDMSGTSDATFTTNHTAIPGSGAGLPPQCSICISWSINARYRGGKPRWYLTGIQQAALSSTSNSALDPTYATNVKTAANTLQSNFNASAPNGHDVVLGTLSYFTNHTMRPTPLFRPFGAAKVHERMDSQRRRSGRETAFAVAG